MTAPTCDDTIRRRHGIVELWAEGGFLELLQAPHWLGEETDIQRRPVPC